MPDQQKDLLYPTQAARLWGTCNYPLSLFACLFRQAHALRSFGQPIYIEVSGLRVIQVPHGLSCLLSHNLLAYRVWPEGKVWTACAAAVGIYDVNSKRAAVGPYLRRRSGTISVFPSCLALGADRAHLLAKASSGTLKEILLGEASALLGCDAEPFFEVSIERAVLLFGCFAGCVEIPRLSGQESKQRLIAFL